MFIRAYLRASTDDQDANRGRASVSQFCDEKGARVASWYVENVSGAASERAELHRLIDDSHRGDVLLIEKVDRLSRLPYGQWKELRQKLHDAGLHIVVVDQPMTHSVLGKGNSDSSMISRVLTEFMIDLAAAMARDDYETRIRRQREGIEKAKKIHGKYRGKPRNEQLHSNILMLLQDGKSWSQIVDLLGCSRSTVARVAREKNSGKT
ncbi:site-specific recombinase resolvase family [Vibrio astriarenae]|nr:site-specific recombinase resolvase family [Vibrio sp. C7]